jgi:hypothetical protein
MGDFISAWGKRPTTEAVPNHCVKGSPLVPQKFRGELFTLMAPHPAWYPYRMDNLDDAAHSPASAETARSPFSTKTIFDGTKLSVVEAAPKTTTNGINRPFRPNSMRQNCAIRSPTLMPERFFPVFCADQLRPPQIDATEVTLCQNC